MDPPRRIQKTDHVFPPPQVKLNLDKKEPFGAPYVSYDDWKAKFAIWTSSPIRQTHTQDHTYVFMSMFETMEGSVAKFAVDFVTNYGYHDSHETYENFLKALNTFVKGDRTLYSNLSESLYREFYAYNPRRSMNTFEEFTSYYNEFVDKLCNANPRGDDIIASDFRTELAYDLKNHIEIISGSNPSVLSSVAAMKDCICNYYNSQKFLPSRPTPAMPMGTYTQRDRSGRYSRGRGQRIQYSHPQIEYNGSSGDGGPSRGGGRAPFRGRGGRSGRVDHGGRGGRGGGRGRNNGYSGTPLSDITCYKCGQKGHFADVCPKKNVYHVHEPNE